MKGLLIKDFQLLKENKNLLFITLFIAVIFMLTQKEDAAFFLVSFVTMIMGMLSITTISYDELNHGNTFLFTLPISRKSYVMEKYVLGLTLILVGWIVASGIGTLLYINSAISDLQEWFLFLGALLMVGVLLISILFPIILKVGADKGRIAILAFVMGILVVGFALKSILEMLNINYMATLYQILSLDYSWLGGIAIVVSLLILATSYALSVSIMKHKQF